MMRRLLFILLLIIPLFSCSNDEEKALREKLEKTNFGTQKDARNLSAVQVSQYEDTEIALNTQYVKDLKNLVDSSFEKQIVAFEDEELGVIAGYKYMFKYFTLNNDEWDDLQIQLSDKYFNTLNVEQMTLELSMDHQSKVNDLRTKFSQFHPLKAKALHLPNSKVYLGTLEDHSKNNFLIEIGTTVLDILLGLLIGWVVVNIVGYATTGPVGCIISIVTFIIIVIVSVICTNYNDNKLIESLRQQQEKRYVNYDLILKDLNSNTYKFYSNEGRK